MTPDSPSPSCCVLLRPATSYCVLLRSAPYCCVVLPPAPSYSVLLRPAKSCCIWSVLLNPATSCYVLLHICIHPLDWAIGQSWRPLQQLYFVFSLVATCWRTFNHRCISTKYLLGNRAIKISFIMSFILHNKSWYLNMIQNQLMSHVDFRFRTSTQQIGPNTAFM